jgi:hypothetical protein
MLDWQMIGTVVPAVGVMIAFAALAYQIKASRDERKFDTFIRFLDAYERQRDRRQMVWRKIKEALRAAHAQEVDDTKSTVDYLVFKDGQSRFMLPVEHELLEEEIRSLNILNELCRLAAGDENRVALLASLLSSEISFYQNKLSDIEKLRDFQRRYRLFSMIRSAWLMKFDVQDYYDRLPGQQIVMGQGK